MGIFSLLMNSMGFKKGVYTMNRESNGSKKDRSKKTKHRYGKPVESTGGYYRDEHGCIRKYQERKDK